MSRPAVIVTGAAGGIGRSICSRFRSDGRVVIGFDRNACTDVDQWIDIDIGDLGGLRQAAAEISSQHPLAAVVHNAAVQPMASAGDTPYATFVETMRVNVLAADSLVHATRENLSRERGSVVVVSSVHASATTAGINAYATSKAALEGWVRSAAIDLGPTVRVNAVRPGAIDTAKLQEGFARWGEEVARERRSILESRTPLRRIGTPDEIAAAVSFLAGPEASFITGSTMIVDGGASACLGTE
ncbi:MAG: SDR family oxidoreductase [Propionibacteriales bacterium]|nr:SDR family oxidoreductase [Propionibacteriales bacterium]